MVAETEACHCCVLLEAEGSHIGQYNGKHALSFCAIVQLPLLNFRLSYCFHPQLYITPRDCIIVILFTQTFNFVNLCILFVAGL